MRNRTISGQIIRHRWWCEFACQPNTPASDFCTHSLSKVIWNEITVSVIPNRQTVAVIAQKWKSLSVACPP